MNVKDKIDDFLYQISNPERYIGNEWNQIKKEWNKTKSKVVMAFPDVYEIGMSHLGMKIIYHLLNQEDDILCERTFAPWFDMEKLLEKKELPLYALESGRAIKDFDILGFTLQYEMSYTNILNMLDLSDLALRSCDRDKNSPLVIAGGATVFNPEPLTPFIDLFFIGESEEMIVDLVREHRKLQSKDLSRDKVLERLNKLPGVYVPSLYSATYKDGESIGVKPIVDKGTKEVINRQIVKDLDNSFYPTDFIVPYMDIVHNRAVLEIARGCTRGCRFCLAGMSYRPTRERKKETLLELVDKILRSTGYGELSFASLSTADHSQIEPLIKEFVKKYEEENISLSLPSLRVDEFSVKLAREVEKVKKTGLTFAPEAGTQRLRNVINKGVEEKNLYDAVRAAFNSGWHRIKLYFMIDLPTETEEDLAGIAEMAKEVLQIGREIRKNTDKRMKRIEVQVSVSTFIPKPFTPFQWVGMPSRKEIVEKQNFLKKKIRGRGLKFSWNDPDLSLLEGFMARGDRLTSDVLETVWEKGARFDSWSEYFKPNLWYEAIEENNLKIEDYTGSRELSEVLPWSHLNLGLTDSFLKEEYKKALDEKLTEDCRDGQCSRCDVCHDLGVDLDIAGAGIYED